MIKNILCKLGVHVWVPRATVVIEHHQVFGKPVKNEFPIKRCIRCQKWNIDPKYFGFNIE